jgi:hypothetical protein
MPPLPVSDEKLEKNIVINFGDIFRLLDDASHVKTRARTVYYKCAFLLIASIIEALVFHFIECRCAVGATLVSRADTTKLKGLQLLHSSNTGSSKKLLLAEEIPVPATFKGITENFNKMNEFCKKHLSIDAALFADLDYVRRKRNEIHIQSLPSTAHSFTKVQINKAGITMIRMLTMLETVNPT